MITRENLDCSEDELQEKLNKYNYIKILNPKWLTGYKVEEIKSQIVPITDNELIFEYDEEDDIQDYRFLVSDWNIKRPYGTLEMFLSEFNHRDFIFVTDKYAEKYLTENGYTTYIKDN
jgi:hypothetical protein